MARLVLFIPDLLFGSNVVGALKSAGHDPVLVGDADSLARELSGAQVLVVDLTADPAERLESIEGIPRDAVGALAFYSHVEADVRTQAEQAGFDLVVPRSRMAREGPSLVARLLQTAADD